MHQENFVGEKKVRFECPSYKNIKLGFFKINFFIYTRWSIKDFIITKTLQRPSDFGSFLKQNQMISGLAEKLINNILKIL